jgi:hypothetical protein
VFAFPLRLGGVRLGALNVYRDRPGALSDDQHADGLALADMIAGWVLDTQAGAPAGAVAEKVELGADFHYGLHNAAGMVSVQLGVSVAEALSPPAGLRLWPRPAAQRGRGGRDRPEAANQLTHPR